MSALRIETWSPCQNMRGILESFVVGQRRRERVHCRLLRHPSLPQPPLSTTSTTIAPDTTTTSTTPDLTTTFCVVADAPYRHSEYLKLLDQVQNMDNDCEFVAHLGDIRSARNYDTCVKETYTNASFIMKKSQKPVLMMLGGKLFARSE